MQGSARPRGERDVRDATVSDSEIRVAVNVQMLNQIQTAHRPGGEQRNDARTERTRAWGESDDQAMMQ